eukprot:GSChrysophyteH2.ASY1.ANO1.116.1 assembled CDS
MESKLRDLAKRRGISSEWTHRENSNPRTFPNILMILVDDLGYGDTSNAGRTDIDYRMWPCDLGGVLTPNLERMAARGTIMTNFHAAAPVCSPSRVSFLTSLYPSRLGALNAFELGWVMTQRNGFLPQIPTGPEILREYGYYTGHSGKWHLGGMREEQRKQRVYNNTCIWPGPNQHGFQDYISELDGPEKILSDREANDAIRMIKQMTSLDREQPWYIQTWFNAPHGPWELLPSGEELYSKYYNVTYKSMISAMDASIGRLLNTLEELDIEENTLVVFASDNGPENGAGNSGPYQQRKRLLMEGGVRVPAIWQWKNTIPAGQESRAWSASVDLFPTFLEASGIPIPGHVQWDGVSLLSALLHPSSLQSQDNTGADNIGNAERNQSQCRRLESSEPTVTKIRYGRGKLHDRKVSFSNDADYNRRLFLWHKDTEVPVPWEPGFYIEITALITKANAK